LYGVKLIMRVPEVEADAFYENLKYKIFRQIQLRLNEGERVLDIGCGDCKLVEYLAKKEKIKITGIDKNGAKLPDTQNVQYKKFMGKMHCVKANAASMKQFADKSFSAVVSVYSLHEFSNVHRVLSECRRVLKKNGKIIAVDFLSGTLADRSREEEYYTQEQLRDMLEEAGFEIAEEKKISKEGPLMLIGLDDVKRIRRVC
jgi:ubiquinone/menaquinone biosynthesis C-methylase UbiE